jgi:cold shock protein
MTRANVRWWSDEEEWGILDVPQAPGGIFVHFSFIEMEGYRSLTEGQSVDVELEGPLPFDQDGCRWRGSRVRPLACASQCIRRHSRTPASTWLATRVLTRRRGKESSCVQLPSGWRSVR